MTCSGTAVPVTIEISLYIGYVEIIDEESQNVKGRMNKEIYASGIDVTI
jgi:hypothetical protein